MVPGFNHNVTHNQKTYHIQTEDSGLDNPHIITLLYHSGTIVAKKKTSYADILKMDRLADLVKELMEEQHKAMLRDLIRGGFDQAKPTTPPAKEPSSSPESTPIQPSPPKSPQPHLPPAPPDEPTGNLDADNTSMVMDILNEVNARGTTVIVATHDTALIEKYPRRVIHLADGRISS